jgi:crotonobetainyl-CoA:carnitine CoA-transferase CaiB-like acyl-CoA transferase
VTGLLREPDAPPVAPRAGEGDQPTGLVLLVAILAALRVRDMTGEGQLVETALMRVGAWTVGCDVAVTLVDHRQPTKRGRKIAELPELVDDPQARGMGMFAEVEHPDVGRFETLAAPFSFERSEVAVRGRAPEVGEHTEGVLAELNRSSEEIATLTANGVVAVPPNTAQ